MGTVLAHSQPLCSHIPFSKLKIMNHNDILSFQSASTNAFICNPLFLQQETQSVLAAKQWHCFFYSFININQLDALNFLISLFQASTCFENMCSSSGGQKLYYTVSGIITPIGGCPVHRLTEDWMESVHGTATYRCDDTRDCIIQFLPSWRWAHVLEACRGLK